MATALSFKTGRRGRKPQPARVGKNAAASTRPTLPTGAQKRAEPLFAKAKA